MDIESISNTITREGKIISEHNIETPGGYYSRFVYLYNKRYYEIKMLNGTVLSLDDISCERI